MDEDWWPDMLRHLATPDPWADEMVTVAELVGYDDPGTPGQRMMWSALVRPEDLAQLDGDFRAFHHEVESTGRPGPGAAGQLEPRFYISAYTEAHRFESEPLVLGWTNNNKTVLMLDPRFAMTYGLMPRALADGSIHWNDPAAPEFDVAIVDGPSFYQDLSVSGARALVNRRHLQDYLTLRVMHLVQGYYEIRSAARDDSVDEALAGESRRVVRLGDREIDVWRNRDGTYGTQVWGARIIAGPGGLPVTVDDLDHVGLQWLGRPGAVTHEDARRLRVHDWVYVSDTVLGAYEGRPGFHVHPESGGVSFGGQWNVGHCGRLGRDVIRVELKKLYEGTPDRVIRHWHAHALAPRPEFEEVATFRIPNVATRAREIVHRLSDIGELLSSLTEALGLPQRSAAALVGLDRAQLDYAGWWMGPSVEPVARHAPRDMSRDGFLDRCMGLDKLVVEALSERFLRPIVRAISPPPDDIDRFRGLKLLDRLTCLAQVANAGGLSVTRSGEEVAARYYRDGTDPPQPLLRLFVLSDLRQLKGHRKQDVDVGVEGALARLGIDAREAAGGWGTVADQIYDGVIEDLGRLRATLASALETIAANASP